jgi:hypothetical protein
MSKFILAILAGASLLAVCTPASAWWYDAYGYYHCVNYWNNGYYLGCY